MDFILGKRIAGPREHGGYFIARPENYAAAKAVVAEMNSKVHEAASASDKHYFNKHRHRKYRLRKALKGEFPSSRWVLVRKLSAKKRFRLSVPNQIPIKAVGKKYGANIPDTVLIQIYDDIERGFLPCDENGEFEY